MLNFDVQVLTSRMCRTVLSISPMLKSTRAVDVLFSILVVDDAESRCSSM